MLKPKHRVLEPKLRDALTAAHDTSAVSDAVFQATQASEARAASDAEHQKIDQEMDDAFVKNMAKHQKIQADKKAARRAQASPADNRRQLAEEAYALEREGLTPAEALQRVLNRHHLTRWPGPLTPTGQTSSPPLTAQAPSATRSAKVPRAAREQHAQVDREMNEAFARNVTKNKQFQADVREKRLRET